MKTFYLLFLLSVTAAFSQHAKKNELLVPYRDGNLWGLCDTLGRVKVKPFTTGMSMVNFATTPPDFKGRYVIQKNGKISIIDQHKRVLLAETNLDSVQMYLFSKVVVMYKNNKKGLLRDFKMLIPVQYDDVEFAENESFTVEKKGKKGLVNSKGKLIIPIAYTNIYESWSQNSDENSNKFYWIAKNENSDGEEEEVTFTDNRVVGEERPEWYNPPVVGMKIQVTEEEENRQKRIGEKYGKVVSSSINANSGNIDMYIVKMSEGYGVYSINQDKIILKSDDNIEVCGSNNDYTTFLIKKNGQMGLVDETGKVLLDYEYDTIEVAWGNVCILKKGDKKGMFVLNSIYKPVKPKYKEIKILDAIPVSDTWQFGVFEVTTVAGKKGLLGENGVEYFKN
ncbi:WG repeat-containing protein [Flavobacterium cerinum]|uniref:WG repeat-containing protein n=1 Tax=Flavobacterium cerinum TaxID=2502784 RepID=A0ABY5J0E3_9FLAO|nr:WG repeat-containing protein [Flavobacterium cerinum]UUC47226.1 WG repeat-containing protein [Flavobacterium cerinum]